MSAVVTCNRTGKEYGSPCIYFNIGHRGIWGGWHVLQRQRPKQLHGGLHQQRRGVVNGAAGGTGACPCYQVQVAVQLSFCLIASARINNVSNTSGIAELRRRSNGRFRDYLWLYYETIRVLRGIPIMCHVYITRSVKLPLQITLSALQFDKAIIYIYKYIHIFY